MRIPLPEQEKVAEPCLNDNASPMFEFDEFPEVLIALTESGVVHAVNKTGQDLLGYSVNELDGRNMDEFVFPEDCEKTREFLKSIRQKDSVKCFENRLLRKNGSIFYISWSSYWSGKQQLIIMSGRDVSDYIFTQKTRFAKEHLFQAMIENSFDLLALTDAEGRYLYVSDTFHDMFGYQTTDLLGTVCFSYMHPDDLPRIMSENTVMQTEAKKIYVSPYRFRDAAGNWLWIESVVTNQLNHPDIRGIVVSARDVTNQFNTEAKLKEMQLLKALQEGEEKERSRIARDLHDEISGMIAAAKMQFSSLTAQAPEIAASDGYQQGMDLLTNAALQVRRTSHNLMPEILLENGLTIALQRYCSSISCESLTIEYFSLGENRRYSPAFELSLYRIAQEIIGNVLKHSGAAKALVQLSQHQNVLSLTIEDNGRGFCRDDKMKGTGLHSIKKRVEAMNGFLEIQSDLGNGTNVYLEFES